MSRRLDLRSAKKLRNPSRHIRSLQKWARSFEGYFPTPDLAPRGQWYQKIPIYEKVLSPPKTKLELQAKCAQLMIDATARLRNARPEHLSTAKVYTFISLPNMFESMVEVAFEENPNLFFNAAEREGRFGNQEFWWEYFDVSPDRIRQFDLMIPDEFDVIGTGVRRFDASWMSAPVESEEWAFGEIK